jgi:hypothetical protein
VAPFCDNRNRGEAERIRRVVHPGQHRMTDKLSIRNRDKRKDGAAVRAKPIDEIGFG